MTRPTPGKKRAGQRIERDPEGRLTNYVRYTKTDMEARCEIERIPGSSPQRITRWRSTP